MHTKTVSILGLGYIGLPTAAILAEAGCQVIGVDINPFAVETINRGEIHIVEPELAAVVARNVAEGRLRATLTPEPADAFLITVPTPFEANHQPDLSYVKAATLAIAPQLKAGDVVILESTSPVGTTEQVATWIAEQRPDLDIPGHSEQPNIAVAYCPERVLPGKIMAELVSNDRVIGGITPECSRQASELYHLFLQGQCLITNARTAEMCKLTENSFRDVNIAFANELSVICHALDIDVWQLIRLANHHPRVNILQPGPGVGGHCIAVDPWFIVAQSPELARLIRTAREVNDSKPFWVLDQVKKAVADCLMAHDKRASEIRIACFGLAFKPDIDDLRESPAVQVARLISDWHQGETLLVEPHIRQLPTHFSNKAALVSIEEALKDADILVLLTDHQVFKTLHRQQFTTEFVIDTRGAWGNSVGD
ncbi:UDP-N-acetyl-D-mannosamine dehydrogenase [Rosenbergiella australiborealis]|uniref:UDP-N-acetyl-D-mannosamine dehydrogenase n=1 Tax=Rosenbergiella australiborealis TaxID=1544696 RepID=UPI001F4D930B|nr:UDP-N-acetyl-D-mannosamine dehydrogenase [Rosenbergiella australiborealis]